MRIRSFRQLWTLPSSFFNHTHEQRAFSEQFRDEDELGVLPGSWAAVLVCSVKELLTECKSDPIPSCSRRGLNPYACLGASYGPTEVPRMLLFPSKKEKKSLPTTDQRISFNLERSTSYSDAHKGWQSRQGHQTSSVRHHL